MTKDDRIFSMGQPAPPSAWPYVESHEYHGLASDMDSLVDRIDARVAGDGIDPATLEFIYWMDRDPVTGKLVRLNLAARVVQRKVTAAHWPC